MIHSLPYSTSKSSNSYTRSKVAILDTDRILWLNIFNALLWEIWFEENTWIVIGEDRYNICTLWSLGL